MGELRAPDPTLSAYTGDQWGRTTVEVVDGEVPIAHRGKDSRCVLYGSLGQLMSADRARWFAVPCRECFPDAPEPGERPCLTAGCRMDHGRYLRWQVSP